MKSHVRRPAEDVHRWWQAVAQRRLVDIAEAADGAQRGESVTPRPACMPHLDETIDRREGVGDSAKPVDRRRPEALKANLRRRKAQARAQGAAAGAGGTAAEAPQRPGGADAAVDEGRERD